MSQPLRLRIVTFNIHGGRPPGGRSDLLPIARLLEELQPDVIALQEVHRYLPPPGVFSDQPRRLAALLGMKFAFVRSFGVGGFGYGNAILTRARPLRVRRRRLPGAGEPRTALEAVLCLGTRSIRVLNTHYGLCPQDRIRQAEATCSLVRSDTGPLLLAGDLNAAPFDPELRLLEEAGLRHCVDPELPSFPAALPRVRLDYLLASRHFHIERGFSVPTTASDHWPMAADLVLE